MEDNKNQPWEYEGEVYLRPMDRGLVLDFDKERDYYFEDAMREVLIPGASAAVGEHARLRITVEVLRLGKQ